MTYAEARAQFPVLERLAYLQAGSVGPLARGTTEAMRAAEESALHDGRGALAQFMRLLEAREELRGEIAALVGVSADTVALTASTTDGCNIALAGLDLREGDEVITTTDEHFGLIGPLHTSGARVVVAEPEPERIIEAVTPRTRLIALSHVLWTTGAVLPVHELKALDRAADPRRRSAVGRRLPRRRERARLLHDLRAEVALRPGGDGRARRRRARGAPRRAAELPLPAGVRERRTLRAEGRCGALRSEPDTDGVRRRAAGCDLSDPDLGARTRSRDWRSASGRDWPMQDATSSCPEQRATLVSWRVPAEESADVVARLAEAGVIVRDLPGRGLVRASVGWWNDESDLERLVAAL